MLLYAVLIAITSALPVTNEDSCYQSSLARRNPMNGAAIAAACLAALSSTSNAFIPSHSSRVLATARHSSTSDSNPYTPIEALNVLIPNPKSLAQISEDARRRQLALARDMTKKEADYLHAIIDEQDMSEWSEDSEMARMVRFLRGSKERTLELIEEAGKERSDGSTVEETETQ
jgi:16S rRNA C1402 (ribose-2'-O) methylase RsmI